MASTSTPSRRYTLPLLDQYVLRQLLVALLALTGGAVALIWLTQSLHFVSLIVQHGLAFHVFFGLTSLLLPYFIAIILPITTFLVILFTYQRLSGDRELTVMRAAGQSPLELARPGLLCTLIATLTCYALTLWIVPASSRAFHHYEFQIRNQVAAFLLQDGVPTKVADHVTVYVRSRDSNGLLQGVLVDDERNPEATATILAEHGAIVTVKNQPRVVLYNGSRQEVDRRTGRLNVLTFGRNTIDLTGPQQNSHEYRTNDEMTFTELFHPDSTVSAQDRAKRAVDGWNRLTSPLTVFSYAMVALVAALRGTFSRHGTILRPLIAILTIVALLALSLFLKSIAGRHLSLVPLLWIFALLPGLICSGLLFAEQWTGTTPAQKHTQKHAS